MPLDDPTYVDKRPPSRPRIRIGKMYGMLEASYSECL